MLAGVAGEDDAGIVFEREGKQLAHLRCAHRASLVQNDHASRVQSRLHPRIDEKTLKRERIKAILAEHVGCRAGGSAEHAIATGLTDRAGKFGERGAFARSGQPANAGETIRAFENEFDGEALIIAESGRDSEAGVDGSERLLAFVH